MRTENRQLSLFAQINCLELLEHDLYPKEGILQFWFLDNFERDIDWDDLTNQDNFRVVYHKEFGEHYTKEKLKEMLHPYQKDEPLFGENTQYEMIFKAIESHLNYSSVNFAPTRWNSKFEPERNRR